MNGSVRACKASMKKIQWYVEALLRGAIVRGARRKEGLGLRSDLICIGDPLHI